MFGYIKIYKDELLVREYEAYKAVYCGLCKKMGKDYSFLSRFLLSYDCTFYAIFLMSQKYKCTGFERKRCTCNPLKKCTFCTGGEQALSKAAALSVILAYYKLVDNIHDSGFFKRNLIKIVKPLVAHWRKKAKNKYPYMDDLGKNMMESQLECESREDCCLDMAAEPTAKMLSQLLSTEAKNSEESLVYSQFGYQIGRWIYLMDAVDDYDDDKKSGGFNPFLLKNGDFPAEQRRAVLSRCLAQAYDAYNLLDICDFKGILDNVILKGLPVMQKQILSGRKGVKNERSV